MARVLVLNATFEPINVCTLRRAAVLLLKQKAELLEQREGAALHSEHMTLERPDVIRLVEGIRGTNEEGGPRIDERSRAGHCPVAHGKWIAGRTEALGNRLAHPAKTDHRNPGRRRPIRSKWHRRCSGAVGRRHGRRQGRISLTA